MVVQVIFNFTVLTQIQIYANIHFNNFKIDYLNDFNFYQSWAESYELTNVNEDRLSDPDEDLINNFLEFVYGGNPTNSDAMDLKEFVFKIIMNKPYLDLKLEIEVTETEHGSMTFLMQPSKLMMFTVMIHNMKLH